MRSQTQVRAPAKTARTAIPMQSPQPPIAVPDQAQEAHATATQVDQAAHLGHNFGRIGVHYGEAPVTQPKLIVGANAGQFATGTNQGSHLIAHELTHIVQRAPTKATPTLEEMFADYNNQRSGSSPQSTPGAVSNPVVSVDQQKRGDKQFALREGRADAARIRKSGELDRQALLAKVQFFEGEAKQVYLQQIKSAVLDQVNYIEMPPVYNPLALLAHNLDIVKKHQAATELNQHWRAKFGERMASYKQAVWRITGGIDAASRGFQEAQMAQAQTDQLEAQLWGLVGSVGFAIGFEWLFGFALGKLGVSTMNTAEEVKMVNALPKAAKTVALPGGVSAVSNVDKVIEKVENPANAAVTGTITNIRSAKIAQDKAAEGQTPDAAIPGAGALIGGSATGFLAQKSEALEHQSQLIEQAFVVRSEKLASLTDEQWETLDVGAQEAKYQALLNDLNNSGNGVEKLKSPEDVAKIIEKYLWKLWIKNQADRQSGGRLHNFGTDIDLRLIKLGVEREAGVLLSEHWWQHSSDNWTYGMDRWADAYKESIVK